MKKLVMLGLGAAFAAAAASAQNAPTPPAGGTTTVETGAADANGVNRTGKTDSSAVQIQNQAGSVIIPDTRTYAESSAGYARSGAGRSGTAARTGANRQGRTGTTGSRTATSGQQY